MSTRKDKLAPARCKAQLKKGLRLWPTQLTGYVILVALSGAGRAAAAMQSLKTADLLRLNRQTPGHHGDHTMPLVCYLKKIYG